ncbi:lipopolysaccharide biosynthesis protein [Bacillus sp. EB600]|uniref:lipopolysaccharide biosynthesis protein n=1 Tax=Bacillus sp. EB600 TaxID=2806345 RepID=UPI00210E40F1|nr:oligosaccharide flippase family protein [Bacillus sp. EB600]MCQ6280008.1 oligosaccharide flippase family protein [Bacillus sp. EB600]
MGVRIFKNRIIKNIFYAFTAQGISLLLSITMSLIVPKVLGMEEFSYWQLFVFYVGYVGFFHLGLNDGIYLRLGGDKYENLNYSLVGTQFKLSVIFQSIFSCIVILVTSSLVENSNRKFIIAFVAIYLVLSNATLFIGYIFQSVNRTKIFSFSVIIDRAFVLVSIIIFIVIRVDTFEPFIIAYLFSKLCGFIYCACIGRKIVRAKWYSTRESLKEMWINMSVGVKLMLANIGSMFILGSGRMVIDKIWGITSFGKFSLSLSLTNFFLVFIAQVSMVLFPVLRQVDEKRLKGVYSTTRALLGLFLPVVFLAYIPMKFLLGLWLPQYQESLQYLALLLPLCTFDGKMQLLCNTYFKVLREEKRLLTYNIVAMVLSIVLSLIGGYLLNNIYIVVISMVVSIAFRSIISELYLAKLMGQDVVISIIEEVILVMVFMGCSWYLNSTMAFIVFVAFYMIYLLINQKKLKQCISLSLKFRKVV